MPRKQIAPHVVHVHLRATASLPSFPVEAGEDMVLSVSVSPTGHDTVEMTFEGCSPCELPPSDLRIIATALRSGRLEVITPPPCPMLIQALDLQIARLEAQASQVLAGGGRESTP